MSYKRKWEWTSYSDPTLEQRGWLSKVFWLQTHFHLFCRCCSWCPQSERQKCILNLKKSILIIHSLLKNILCCHTDLTKEVIHEGGIVHGNLHLIIILITCLPETKCKPSGLTVHVDVYCGTWLHSSLSFIYNVQLISKSYLYSYLFSYKFIFVLIIML